MKILIACSDAATFACLHQLFTAAGHNVLLAAPEEGLLPLLTLAQECRAQVLLYEGPLKPKEFAPAKRFLDGMSDNERPLLALMVQEVEESSAVASPAWRADAFIQLPLSDTNVKTFLDHLSETVTEVETPRDEKSMAVLWQDVEETRSQNLLLGHMLYALEKENHQFREMFQQLPVACFAYDEEGRIQEWNKACEGLYGLSESEAVGRQIWDAVPRADGSKTSLDFVRRVFAGSGYLGLEWADLRVDGEAVEVQCSTFPLRGRDGTIIRAISANVDITARKQAEETLEAQSIRQETLNRLNERALQKDGLGDLLIEAAEAVSKCLRVSCSEVLEFLPGGEDLLLRGGVGWNEGQVGRAIIKAEFNSFVGQVFLQENPLILRDWMEEQPLDTHILHHGQPIQSGVSLAIQALGRPFGILGAYSKEIRTFSREEIQFLQSVAAILSAAIERSRYLRQIEEHLQRINEYSEELEFQKAELEVAYARLETIATTDGLTGLKNHRAFQERMEEEFQRAARYHLPLSIILLDVDHFKQYNDTFGHPAGDQVLKGIAQLMRETARDTDFLARYGGEEFLIILPNTGAEGAKKMAERLRCIIEHAAWIERGVTASLGVSTLTPLTRDRTQMIAEADAALYTSKNAGRNRVTLFQLPGVMLEGDPGAF
jgi:diguanylate cyclase (GGDEF)-like protein/PAS domain S-box-containing protein